MKRTKKKATPQQVIHNLRQRAEQSRTALATQFPEVSKKLEELGLDLQDLRRHSAKMISAAVIAGTILAAAPAIHSITTPPGEERQLSPNESTKRLKEQLAAILPKKVEPLTPEVEERAHQIFQQTLGVNAVAALDGNHLNTTFGYIGAEQHLPRFPGDTAEQHDALQFKGITPGRGAWGYFAPSKSQLTQDDIMKEKYYVAVQTLYLPNWKSDLKRLVKWYKHRRVLVVNPTNGKSVIANVADAGPAAWTGKHFGGSPEVMAELELNRGMQKGAVLLFFLDEREQSLAYGPVEPLGKELIASR
jgi:hypothetical protein